ncbi:MAG: hypothetical protein DMF74_13585 [Acidobacteria bacterium]|nr:MAG: hypothetical protein DMF74_13585 [Acidobacteriota bacterium]
MHQNWGKLLFMHWSIAAELLRPLIPAQLEIDTFEGSAWIGVVPFTMWPASTWKKTAIARTSSVRCSSSAKRRRRKATSRG